MRRFILLPLLALSAACGLFAPAALPPTPAPPEATTTSAPPPTSTPTTTPLPTDTPEPTPVSELPDASRAQWTFVAGGLRSPIDFAQAGDGRLFVVEQRGTILILQDGQLLDEPFLNITDRVNESASERGLLGLAFHPDYAGTGSFFVNYTGTGGDTFIARYQVSGDANRGDRESERILLHQSQPFANHNGGSTVFGPDGTLYLGLGDGGSAGDPQGNGQNTFTWLGKILRIDVDAGDSYGVPPDNPFVNGGGAPEIWAYGLRNPWRFSFDRRTGDLYIGDVGQNRWEEIDYQPAGAAGGVNYGWNIREGSHPFATNQTEDLTEPVAEYSHDLGCSVTGGVVVRSPSLPDWNGVYIYGDYCSGIVWGLIRDAQGAWQNRILFRTGLSISSFGEDAAGNVYLADYGGGVYRLDPIP